MNALSGLILQSVSGSFQKQKMYSLRLKDILNYTHS